MYVYKMTETNPDLWTVGFYSPDGTWNPESDHSKKEEAATRVAFLNGSGDDGNSFRRAVEVAYQRGFEAGQGLKG